MGRTPVNRSQGLSEYQFEVREELWKKEMLYEKDGIGLLSVTETDVDIRRMIMATAYRYYHFASHRYPFQHTAQPTTILQESEF